MKELILTKKNGTGEKTGRTLILTKKPVTPESPKRIYYKKALVQKEALNNAKMATAIGRRRFTT